MNELAEHKTGAKMTTKEVAAVLGVDVRTIQRAVDSLDINVERAGSSHTMLFDEYEVTKIKLANMLPSIVVVVILYKIIL